MSRFLPTAPYRGTRDFLPPEMSVRQQVLHRLYEVAESYGYLRYDGPVLEPAEIYEAKSGQEIAELQLYTLTDRGGRRLALRPEMTPSVARMIAGNAGAVQFPVRWYCNANCHRYERPQRGRTREHWRINVDIFGSDSPNADIEILNVVHDMMAAMGATRDMYVLRASDRVLLESILTQIAGITADRVRAVSDIIDRWEKGAPRPAPGRNRRRRPERHPVRPAGGRPHGGRGHAGEPAVRRPGPVAPDEGPAVGRQGSGDLRPAHRPGLRVLHVHGLRGLRP